MNRRLYIKAVIGIILSTVRAEEKKEKVLRSLCPVCKGTGRVKAGDGTTIVTRECDNCIPDPATPAAKSVRYMVVHTTDGCAACQQLERGVLRRFSRQLYRTVKNDRRIALFPTIVLYEQRGGQTFEIKRHVGSLSWREWNEMFYYDKKSARELRAWCQRNKVAPVGVVNMTYQYHMTDTKAEAHHMHFEDWQLEGLTIAELAELHGAQHAGMEIQ